jgi:GT2 family glycosyltransferase
LTIVDNASTDPRNREILEEYMPKLWHNPYTKKTRVIYNEKNEGYAKAVNKGVSLEVAPLAAALNCDIELRPGLLSGVRRAFEDPANARVGIMGPRTTDRAGRITHGGICYRGDGAGEYHRWFQIMDTGQVSDIVSVPTVSGATYFFRREMWEELTTCPDYQRVDPGSEGAFLTTPFHYYEERWCSLHARHHGWDIQYRGDLHMIHAWHRSSPVGSNVDVAFQKAQAAYFTACTEYGIRPEG